MTSDFELARMLFPREQPAAARTRAPRTVQVRGFAASDSTDGTVTVVLDAEAGGIDAVLEVPTAGGITEGSEVIVTLLDGVPVDVVQAGSIDSAATTATAFLTVVDSSGLLVHREGDTTTGVRVADVVSVVREGEVVAEYGPTARIGPIDSTNTQIGAGTFKFVGYGNEALRMALTNPGMYIQYGGYVSMATRPSGASGTWTVDISDDLADEHVYLGSVSSGGVELADGVDYVIDTISGTLTVSADYSRVSLSFEGKTVPMEVDVDFLVYDGIGNDASNLLMRVSSEYDYTLERPVQTIVIGRSDSAQVSLSGDSVTVTDPNDASSTLQLGAPSVVESTDTMSAANSTNTTATSVSLPPGTWLVTVSVLFAANATGRRVVYLSDDPNVASVDVSQDASVIVPAVNGGTTKTSSSAIVSHTTTTTYYCRSWQNSGGALSVSAHVKAVRIT